MVFSSKGIEDQEVTAGEDSKTLLTIIGNKAKIEGKLDISHSIEIGCEIVGELKVDGQMVIQKEGVVSADVTTIDAKIIGKFEGNLKGSGKVEITETGIVNGNIKTDSLIISEGGVFSGKVTRMSQADEKDKKKSRIKEDMLEKDYGDESKEDMVPGNEEDIKEFEPGDIDDTLKL
ncbi:MAG: polymer-forming cytoskeletal protein [Actinobacteria bacterium]|nr:polymer-forming cytoskeletal protein [Actinomycetota bacterium]